MAERTKPLERVTLLPAYIEIMIAVGERERAAGACDELAEIADLQRSEVLNAMSAQQRGNLLLTEEVLRLVAAGKSNREIGAALFISEHTVARHFQNLFMKLGVTSRTAVGSFAYEHKLMKPAW